MAFNPSSTIYLCNVPIDSTYQNEIYFANRTTQQNYFESKVVKTFSDYLTVRTTRPDGSFQSSVKVGANIDVLRSLPCNYMYYQNANHGMRYFYAFITKIIYVNENTTELVFETDVYQTWLFDVRLLESYVVREHSATDMAGDNLVPEKFNFQDYHYFKIYEENTLDEWGYLVGCTDNDLNDPSVWEELFGGSSNPVINGKMMSGIYQGLFFYYFHNENRMNQFLNEVVEKNGDCVMFIAVVPKFSVSGNTIGANDADRASGQGWLYYSDKPAEKDIRLENIASYVTFDGYIPKNYKLYTSPFFKLVVTNHQGQEAEYNIEDFGQPTQILFTMYGDVSANPSVMLVPNDYQGINPNIDCGITITGFPQASYNTDTFKLWLAKNQYGVALDTIGNIGQIVAGVMAMGASPVSGGISGAIGLGTIANGAQGVLSTMNGVYQASREPNKAQGGGGKTNLLTSMKMNKFDFYVRFIKKEHAIAVDNFFTMYGYQTNKLKVPNVDSRPYFNYVQTVDVNIVGAIPNEDMEILKSIYNKGVTLWKSHATVGDYSVNNRPEEGLG